MNVGHLNMSLRISLEEFELIFHLAIKLRVGVSDNKDLVHIRYLMNN